MLNATSGAFCANHSGTNCTSVLSVVSTCTASNLTPGSKNASGTIAGDVPNETRRVRIDR